MPSLKTRKKNIDNLYAQMMLREFDLIEISTVINNSVSMARQLNELQSELIRRTADTYTLSEYWDTLKKIYSLYQEANEKLQKIDELFGFEN